VTDERKTKKQLIDELAQLRRRVDELGRAPLSAETDTSRAHMKALTAAGIGLDIVSTDYRVLSQNSVLAERFGDLAGELCYKSYVGRDEPCESCPMEKAVAGGEVARAEITAANGRTYEIVSAPLVGPDGVIDSVAEVVYDITGRKQSEERLRRSEERFRNLVESAFDGINICEFDPAANKRRLLFCNDRYVEMSGYTREELVDAEDLNQLVVQRDTQEKLAWHYDCIVNCVPFTGTASWKRPDGRDNAYEWSGVSVKVGEKFHIHGVDRDVTERIRTERALKTERDRAQQYLDVVGVIILALNADGEVALVNPKGCEVLGYAQEEIVGKNWFDTFLPEEHRDAVAEVFRRLMRGEIEPVEYFENPVLTATGEQRTIAWHNTLLRDEGGTVVGTLASGEDITERKQAEEELRRERNNLIGILEAMQDGVYMVNQQYDIQYVNAVLQKDFGAYEGRKCYEYFHDRTGVCPWCKNEEVWAGKTVQWEWYSSRNGKTYDLLDTPIGLEDGSKGKLEIFRDITERKRAEEELKRSVDIVNNIQVGLYICRLEDIRDTEGRTFVLISANRAAVEMAGIPLENLIGKTIDESFPNLRDAGLAQACAEVVRSGKAMVLEDFQYRDERVGEALVALKAFPLPDNCVGIIFEDITERRRLAEQLRQAEKMEAVGQLAGGIAHDFNNQLAGIMGYADLLVNALQDESHREMAEAIVKAAKRSADLTRQLVAFARKGKDVAEPVDIHGLVAEVIALLEHSIDKRIEIRQHLDADPSTTRGDPSLLENALLNVSINASDAMPDGGELVFATRVVTLDEDYCRAQPYEMTPGRYVRVRVTDSGVGMDEETRKHIFEPFFTTKEQGKGTGMGLAAVYGTVKSHRGAVNVRSEPGSGTTVEIFLPLAESPVHETEAPTAPAKATRTGRILVVDDEEAVRDVTVRMLRKFGYTVTAYAHGALAVAYYRRAWRDIDLVILDMMMPGISGRDTFIAMRTINPDVKALLSSGYGMNAEAQRALDEGAIGFLRKPIKMTALARKVAKVLGA